MAVTGEEVFRIAMVLIDEVTDQGTINASDVMDYKGKAPALLTTLQAELLPITETPTIINDLTMPLKLSDKICLMVLPYGLAANYMLTEDKSAASYFNQKFEELRAKIPTKIVPISDKYNVTGGMR